MAQSANSRLWTGTSTVHNQTIIFLMITETSQLSCFDKHYSIRLLQPLQLLYSHFEFSIITRIQEFENVFGYKTNRPDRNDP